jgi:prepilin-type N-terminal cleavage/methylation domain-containing protein
MKSSGKEKGFSLVELLVVVAILAALVTVAVVQYMKFIDLAKDKSVESDGHEIHKAIQTDKLAIQVGHKSGALTEGLTASSTCQELLDQTVATLVKQNKKNPFDQSFLVVRAIPDGANLRRGNIYLSCAKPEATITSTEFYLQTCICTESDCELTPIIPGDTSPLNEDICYRLPS